jgi:hypothetical protein
LNGTTPQHGVSNFGTVIPSLDKGFPTDSPTTPYFSNANYPKNGSFIHRHVIKDVAVIFWVVFKIDRQIPLRPAAKTGLLKRIDFKKSSNSARFF